MAGIAGQTGGMPKLNIGSLLGSIGAGIGGIVYAVRASKQAKESKKQLEESIAAAQKDYKQKNAFLDNTFNRQYYSDVTQRTDIQNMMRLLDENQGEQAKRDEAMAAVMGGSPQVMLASQESRNKSYADAMAEIASSASQLKDTYMQNYVNTKMGMVDPSVAGYQQMAELLMQQSAQSGQASNNMFTTALNLAGQVQGGGKDK